MAPAAVVELLRSVVPAVPEAPLSETTAVEVGLGNLPGMVQEHEVGPYGIIGGTEAILIDDNGRLCNSTAGVRVGHGTTVVMEICEVVSTM